MKILLMNVPDAHVGKTTSDWDLNASDLGIFPPMGLLYIAGALRKHGRHEVKILDVMLEQLTIDNIVDISRTYQPDIIGMTVYTPILYDTIELSKRLKSEVGRAHIVWGGPHTSLFPQESIAQSVVDYVFLGEAEESFPAFCDALEDGTELDTIPGIIYRKNGEVCQTGEAGYIKDINSIAFPAYDMVDYKRYFSSIGTGHTVATICSSRGCPFSCTFCCKPYSTYRSRSIENILEEMSLYYDRGIREFFFFDDLFNANATRVANISRGVLDRGWKIVWSFRGRVDSVNPEVLSLAKKAGCRQILFGVEAATDEGLKAIKKKITISQVRDAVKWCREAGILSSTNWIIGFPHQRTREDILDLIKTTVKINSDYAQFNICILYHGTELFDQAVEEGLVKKDVWREFALNPVPNFVEPIWDKNLSREELSGLLRKCYTRFFFRPLPVLKKILALRSWKELRLHLKGALTLLGITGYRRGDR